MQLPKLKLTRARLIAAGGVAAALVVLAALLLVAGPIGHDGRDAFADARPPPGLAERFYPPEGWAWGFVQIGDAPGQRYGVAAPVVVTRADVLIVPDYGESAETWFETARDLTASGYAVWILEGVGQGGSGRLSGQRDLGELKSFDADVAAVRYMAGQVIRPGARRPLIILGEGVGALTAARAVEDGAKPAALILSAPVCGGGLPSSSLGMFGFGERRAPGGEGWRRDGADDHAAGRTHDPWRGAVTHAWQLVNPDLRLGGPSLDWRVALQGLLDGARGSAGAIQVPTLLVEPAGAQRCVAPPNVQTQDIAGASAALELEDDAHRAPWLAAVKSLIAQAAAKADPAASGLVPAAPGP
jgi:lysophospholipase